jgi:hypothetical protein
MTMREGLIAPARATYQAYVDKDPAATEAVSQAQFHDGPPRWIGTISPMLAFSQYD